MNHNEMNLDFSDQRIQEMLRVNRRTFFSKSALGIGSLALSSMLSSGQSELKENPPKNTGGILIFSLPDLPKKIGRHCRVYDNKVFENNHPNFAPKGTAVAGVPAGTGIMIMANRHVEVFGNTIESIRWFDAATQRSEAASTSITIGPATELLTPLMSDASRIESLFAGIDLTGCTREAREQFEQVVRMLADGYTTRRGRQATHVHYDVVNGLLRGRRGARLMAITNGGTIPDQFDYDVVMLPEEFSVGSLNEDFAFESLTEVGREAWRE